MADSPAGHHDEQTFAEWRVELHHKALVQREHRKLGSLIWRMHEQSIAGHMHELLQQSFRRREDTVAVSRREKQNRKRVQNRKKGTFYFIVKVECPLLLSLSFCFPLLYCKSRMSPFAFQRLWPTCRPGHGKIPEMKFALITSRSLMSSPKVGLCKTPDDDQEYWLPLRQICWF